MADFLPYGAQWIDDDDVQAVVECLRSDYLTTGPRIGEFERAVCAAVGAKHGIACSSGTAGLHAAAHVLDLGPDDEVVVPAVTFLATANCIHYCGARVVFCDVDPASGLMRPEDLEAVLTERTKAVFPVHLTGRPVDLDRIASIACEAGLSVVEDAAHALGATLGSHRIGDGTRSVMSVFSFHPVKHITTGEGGLVATANDELAHRLRRFVSHGMERDPAHLERESEGPWYYEQQELGFNYRLTDIQCALGLSQIAKLERFVGRRRELAAHYDRLLTDVPHVAPVAGSVPEASSAYHLYEVLVDFEAAGIDRTELMGRLRERGVGTQVHYIPVPHQPYWRRAGYGLEDLPGAAAFYGQTLSLPLFPRMADSDVERTVDALRAALE